ncbi:MAG: rod shape-determining protein MreC [Flavobacteriales bacterium]|nr:rod shape-determining protein MreC [Flavobacteriales bacterium]
MILIFSKNNPYQHSQFANSSNRFIGEIYNASNTIEQYFSLKKEIELLRVQNRVLQEKIKGSGNVIGNYFSLKEDTVYLQQYRFQSASVIRSTKDKRYNFLTINKGKANGLTKNMGVIGTKGILGYTVACSEHYSTVLPIIHPKFELAVRHQSSQSFGLLTWESTDNWQTATLNDISDFIPVQAGDTIITTGGDGFFPKGELIGTVQKTEEIPGKGTQLITVQLTEGFNDVYSVFIVDDINRIELKQLINSEEINE